VALCWLKDRLNTRAHDVYLEITLARSFHAFSLAEAALCRVITRRLYVQANANQPFRSNRSLCHLLLVGMVERRLFQSRPERAELRSSHSVGSKPLIGKRSARRSIKVSRFAINSASVQRCGCRSLFSRSRSNRAKRHAGSWRSDRYVRRLARQRDHVTWEEIQLNFIGVSF
jgi:hypothetical protein